MTKTILTGDGPYNLAADNHYIINNTTPANQTVLVLPETAAASTVIRIQQISQGGWRLNQNAGQRIYIPYADPTTEGTNGYIISTQFASSFIADFICVLDDIAWDYTINPNAYMTGY